MAPKEVKSGEGVRRRGWAGSRAAFTLVELLVVVAIISVLAAMLLPALGKAKELSRRATCSNNLRQLSLGTFQYNEDFGGYFPIPPAGVAWPSLLSGVYPSSFKSAIYIPMLQGCSYAKKHYNSAYMCPSNPAVITDSGSAWLWATYSLNNNLNYNEKTVPTRMSQIRKTVAVFKDAFSLPEKTGYLEWGARWTGSNFWAQTYPLHDTGQNVSFVDGHVEWATVLARPADAVGADCGGMKANWFYPVLP